MDYKRFFTFEPITENIVTISDNEFYHATKVCRLKVGYQIIICANSDKDYYCTITEITKNSLIAKVDKVVINTTYNDVNITLYVGACKDLDSIIQKAVELGVNKLVPFFSQHSNVNSINLLRLNKIVLESSKQCGRSSLMRIDNIISLEEAVSHSKDYEKVLFFYEQEKDNKIALSDLFAQLPIAVFIGSEGGFSIEEVAVAKEQGADILTLGKRVLRVETAVVSALTLCLQQLGKI